MPAPGAFGQLVELAQLAELAGDDIETGAENILADLSLDERMSMMSGDLDFWPSLLQMVEGGYGHTPYPGGEIERAGLPGVRFTDGPRGITLGSSTCFPVSMARGATWDRELEERVGEAIGAEGRMQGANVVGSVCINLLYHPAWGRAQETYGEDPVHVGELGAAAVRGLQQHVIACVKHFALNNMENARFQVDVTASAQVLHEVYLPHFRRCVDEGAGCVMSAYNSVNGEWCGHSHPLLTEILKERWGFDGFVITDWIYGMRDAQAAANGGQDVEMPFLMHFARDLPALVESGAVPVERVDDAARRILRTMLRAAATTTEPTLGHAIVAGTGHRELAREVAQRSAVLLRNEVVDGEPVLPFTASTKTIAVIGRLADTVNTGDGASSHVRPPAVVTALAGLQHTFGGDLVYDDGSDPKRAAEVAAGADAAVVVVGYTAADEGEYIDMAANPELFKLFPPASKADEPAVVALAKLTSAEQEGRPLGGDREHLTLHDADEELLLAIAAAQPRTVGVVVTGSAVVMERWRSAVPAILISWYSGMEGGHALADLLVGRVTPSGRLPCAFPVDAADLPDYDRWAREVEYGRFHGQQHHDHTGRPPAYPLGWGLSYTEFEYGAPRAAENADQLEVTVDVTNVGTSDAIEVVQCYAEAPVSKVERPKRWLVGFTRVPIEAGDTASVRIDVPLRTLAHWDAKRDDLVVEATTYDLVVAPHAAADGVRTSIKIKKARTV